MNIICKKREKKRRKMNSSKETTTRKIEVGGKRKGVVPSRATYDMDGKTARTT